jgi:hypothetical protein
MDSIGCEDNSEVQICLGNQSFLERQYVSYICATKFLKIELTA